MSSNLCTVKECFWFGKFCRIHKVDKSKKVTVIPKEATDRKELNKLLAGLTRAFLKLHPVCQVEGCKRPATMVHHKRGRVGKFLLMVKYFLAVCFLCHRRIEENPVWAKEMGYSESRLKKEEV